MDFTARFARNIIFHQPENMKISEKQDVKTQWILSPEKCDSLRLKVWLRRLNNRNEQSCYTLKILGERTSRKSW